MTLAVLIDQVPSAALRGLLERTAPEQLGELIEDLMGDDVLAPSDVAALRPITEHLRS